MKIDKDMPNLLTIILAIALLACGMIFLMSEILTLLHYHGEKLWFVFATLILFTIPLCLIAKKIKRRK